MEWGHPRVLKKHYQVFVALLGTADAVVIIAACYVAWAVRRLTIEGFWAVSWENYIVKEPLIIFAVPIGIIMMRASGLYRPRRDKSLFSELLAVLRASLGTVAGVIIVLWAVGNDAMMGAKQEYGPYVLLGHELDTGRVQIGALALALPVFLSVHRFLFRRGLRAVRRRGWNLRHAAVVGDGRLGQIVCRTMDRNSWTGIAVNYFVTHRETPRVDRRLGRPVRAGLDDLERALERFPIDVVYLALPNQMAASLPGVLRRLEKFPVDVRIVPDVNPRYLPQNMLVGEIDGMPVLSYRESPMAGLNGCFKRAIDVVGALAAIVVFAPVMLACAIAVRRSGAGPVIFRQKRVSVGGRVFDIYKFRTMAQVDHERLPAEWTKPGDPRITPIGAFLRKTSLDELPQLFNVLRGEMSLVGPRPERPELIETFREDWRGYMLRQHVKAGITGWAQVNGLRGNTSLRKRIQYDLFYIRNWSLWFDLRILALTLLTGFGRRNAH